MALWAILLAASTPAMVAPQTGADFVGAFKTICFTPFPAPGAFETARVASGYHFEVQPKPVGSIQPGDKWQSGALTLSYVSADWMPINLPSPQCSMKFAMPLDGDHLAMAAMLEKQLGVTEGKSQGKRGSNRTIWNFNSATGEQLRMFFSSDIRGDNLDMTVTLLRLRK